MTHLRISTKQLLNKSLFHKTADYWGAELSG